MGEDFLEKRNRGYRRYRDARREEDLRRNLFSCVGPKQIRQLTGIARDAEVKVGDKVWASPSSADGPVRFYAGDRPAVELDRESTEHLRTQGNTATVAAATVREVQDEFVMLEITTRSNDGD